MALDLDALVNAVAADPTHFAVPITYTPSGRAPINTTPGGSPLTGIFDDAYEDVRLGSDGVPVTSVKPAVGVQLSALGVTPAQNDQVSVNGSVYMVNDVRFDGFGWAQLMLSLAAG
jgi:hypothetical protein